MLLLIYFFKRLNLLNKLHSEHKCVFGSTFDRIDSKRIDSDRIDSDIIDFERIDLRLDTIM